MSMLESTPSERQTAAGLLIIRLVLGTIFVAHGAQKVFTYGMDTIGDGFAQIGIPLAGLMGPLVSLVELLGGIAILLGLLTRPAAVGIAATMLGAIFFAHLPAGFFAPDGFEFPLMLLAAATALAVTGAGRWSVDALLGKRAAGIANPESAPNEAKAQRVA